ncbi:MAG: hypothetical protein LDL33_07500 [Desulfomonile sp.]|nr:hypothetical protein [Desulfomonile sp.]
MRKLVVSLVALIAMAVIPPLTLAHEKSSKESKETKGERVYCCWGKGKCDKQHTKDECDKEGGRVVGNCRDCK